MSLTDKARWAEEKTGSPYTPPRRQPLALDALGTVRKRFRAGAWKCDGCGGEGLCSCKAVR